jgi:hypothetical protein
MELAKSNAFPALTSNLVSCVPSLYERDRASQFQRYEQGVVSNYGLLGSGRNILLAGSV